MRKKLTSVFLILVLVLTSVDITVFATDQSMEEVATVEAQQTEDKGKENEDMITDVSEIQSEGSSEKNSEEYFEKSTESEAQTETLKSSQKDTESETQEKSEMETSVGGAKLYIKETETEDRDSLETMTESETETEEEFSVLFSNDDIGHGVIDEDYGHITWAIDAKGKLTVEGTGNYTGDYDCKYHEWDVPWYNERSLITSAVINITDITSTRYMFGGCNLTSLDINNLDTSKVTDMSYMFYGCSSLTSLDISNLDTSNVTDMSDMFSCCDGLTSLDLSNLDTSNVTDMSHMFFFCDGLTSLNISNFNTSKVTDMSGMFHSCRGLVSLDISNFNTSKVTDMSGMFHSCSGLTSLDISNFDTSNVIDMKFMFCACSGLINLNLSNFNTSKVTNMSEMFRGCRGLISLDISNLNTGNVTDMGRMFYYCNGLKSLDISNFDISNVLDMSEMFYNCNGLTNLNLKFETSNVINISFIFYGCSSLVNLDLSKFETSNVTNMGNMFYGCSSLVNLDLSKFETSNVTNMGNMFYGCSSLVNLDLISFETSNVTSMEQMFCGCDNLTNLDLSNFNLNKVSNVRSMLNCSNLKIIYTPKNVMQSVILPSGRTEIWYRSDGTTVTELPQNLSYSVALGKNFIPEELQLSGVSNNVFWEIDRYGTLTLTGSGDWIRNSDGLGPWCEYPERIKKVIVKLTDTTNADSMFFGCANLKCANLCGFDMTEIVSASDMFSSCTVLDTIYTPLNLSDSVPLPTNMDTDIWYCSDGTVVTELPKNLDYNMVLGKNHIPDEFPKSTTECIGGIINGKGKSYGRVSIVDIGEFVKDKQVRWKFDAGSTEYQFAKTDENGYFMLESPLLSYNANGSNDYTFKTTVAYFTGRKWITVPDEYTLKVKVEPLTVSQKWQLKTEGSFEMGIGAGVGGEVGPAKVKASFGEVGTAASSGGTMSISHGYINGKRKLTLLQTISKDVALKASVGPAVSGSIGAVKGKVKLIGVKGDATVGDSITYGLEIDDYNPADFGQCKEVGKFVATAQMYNTGDILMRQLLTRWGFGNYNIRGAGVESSLSAGTSSFGGGVSDSSGEKIGFSVNVNSTGYERTYSTGFTENGNDKTTKYEVGIASNVKEGILNFSLDGNKDRIEGFSLGSFGASPQNVDISLKTDKDGNLTKAEYTNTTYNSWGVPFYSNTDTNEISFSVSEPDMLQRLETVNRLKNIVNARNAVFFPESYITDTWDDIRENADALEFEVTNKEKSMVKVPIAVGVSAVVSIGAGVEFAGSSDIAYITQTGFAEGDSLYVTAEMQNTQADINNAKMDLSEFFTDPLKAAGEKMGEFLVDVTGKTVNGVKSGLAWVGGKISDGTDWLLHVISVKRDGESRTASMAESFEISTYMTASTETMETPGASMTVGDPYMVYVTDNMGNEVTDFTDHPLVLRLGYDDASLTAAGVTDDTLSAIGIYMYSEDKCGYIYLGGEIDTTNQQVTIDITKPGQYILAADNLAPSVYDIYVSDTSSRPTITAFLSELSGFSQFSMKIDGAEYVNESTLNKYLDQSSGSFVYKIMQDLSAGEHTLSFTATDSRGNATKQPIIFVFVVDSEINDSEFFEVTFDLQGHGVALDEYQTYKNIPAGSRITEPQRPQADGYVFLGWYKDVACKELWDFSSDIVDKNLTLYAAWKKADSEEEDDAENQGDGLWISGVSKLGYQYTGEAMKPVVKVYDKITLLTEKADYTISYKNNTKAGKATITVTGKGNYSGKETVTFDILPADIGSEEVHAMDFYVKIGKKAQKPIPELYYMGIKLKNNKDFTISYSNASNIYTQTGEYSVTVTGKGNYTGTRDLKLMAVEKVVKPKPISIAKAALNGFDKSFTYTGKACKQECTLTVQTSEGGKILVEGMDYTVQYANNIKAGTATVTYYGRNGYTGKLKKTYKILPYDILNDPKAKMKYENNFECIYAKGGSKPKPVVTFEGKALKEGVDYTLSYKNNKAVYGNQTPCVTVNGKGCFKGKIPINFTIKAQDLSKMTLVSGDKVYKNKANIYKITPKLMDFDGKLLSAGKDFDRKSITYVYENDVVLENGISKEAGSDVEKTDIIPADTQIRITLNCGSGSNYTGTFTGTYRIVKADIKSAKVTIPKQIYTGNEIILDKSQITVKLSGVTLKPEDYEIIQYADNVKKGKASVTIKGKGNYGGVKTVKFTIGAKGFLWWWRK